MAFRKRLPGLNYVPLPGAYSQGEPFTLVGFNGRPFKIPETAMLGNCRSVEEFVKLRTIADGKFSTIYKVRHEESNDLYALKKLKIETDRTGQPAEVMPQEFLRMISNMKKLKHPNLLELKEVVAGTSLMSNYLLLDYCRYSLEDVISEVNPVFFQHEHIKNIMLQLLTGLSHMHHFKIIHRDLCTKNIMFTEEGVLKICDFVTSRADSNLDMTPAQGTRCFRAPEIVFGSLKYTKAVDVWAAGCIFGEMILLKPLFEAESDGDLVRAMIDLLGTPSEKYWPGFRKLPVPRRYHLRRQPINRVRFIFHNQTLATVSYLQKFLKYNPASRPSAQQLLEDQYYNEYPRRCNSGLLIFMLRMSEKII